MAPRRHRDREIVGDREHVIEDLDRAEKREIILREVPDVAEDRAKPLASSVGPRILADEGAL